MKAKQGQTCKDIFLGQIFVNHVSVCGFTQLEIIYCLTGTAACFEQRGKGMHYKHSTLSLSLHPFLPSWHTFISFIFSFKRGEKRMYRTFYFSSCAQSLWFVRICLSVCLPIYPRPQCFAHFYIVSFPHYICTSPLPMTVMCVNEQSKLILEKVLSIASVLIQPLAWLGSAMWWWIQSITVKIITAAAVIQTTVTVFHSEFPKHGCISETCLQLEIPWKLATPWASKATSIIFSCVSWSLHTSLNLRSTSIFLAFSFSPQWPYTLRQSYTLQMFYTW